ncbi:amino acid transporter [Striga asiatica]|uniref:Amino acid transporter n=1 Tax=Striga asiatica TaxID=4170 RepID=A0A5A7PL00_STRAF|nr:amino acid transporter [Striga asiatica]
MIMVSRARPGENLYIVVPQQLVVEVGVDIVYMVTGGRSLKRFHDLVCNDCKDIKLTYFIMIFASVHFVLSHLPNFNSIYGVSLAAAVMSLSYSTIAWGASVGKGKEPDVQYGYKASTTACTVFNFFGLLCGEELLWLILLLLCTTFRWFGNGVEGNDVEDNILLTLGKPVWLIAMANMLVVVHVIGNYQIYAMLVFDMIETVLLKKLRFKLTWYLHLSESLCGYVH